MISNKQTTRICLWSGPRNISTALMYSFAQRSDCKVFDEPFYAHYLSKSDARHYHPGAEEVIATMENDGEKVVQDLILGSTDAPVLFFKQMTHHLIDLDWRFMAQTINIILTRDPLEMLPSYAKQVQQPTLHDVGYAMHLKLLDYLQELGQTPPILDSKQTLLNPRAVLRQLCEKIGIPFEEVMLRWPAGARPEDGSWQKYWYDVVHRSTGFQPYWRKEGEFPVGLRPLLTQCQPYYEKLAALAIQA
ncbi:Branched-chain-amino-acid aminotransferase-like protein 2 [hydrothermal vent metagenome]|uniref:Branched-chain-amino-acid aminotransferase-like protein 2 n=1 Tax=hydrothermal vent metagenome TaxID=652676 RepID=A0A3B0W1I5_9ZZZZ